MIRNDEVYQIGHITKAHALKGEGNCMFTDDIFDRIDADYLICEVDGILVPFYIEEYRFRSDSTALVKFADLDSSDAVQFLIGCDVYFEKRLMDESDEDDVALNYFIGFKMVDEDNGKEIGTISDIDDKTENWLFIVETPEGNELMIPAHEEFIAEIKQEEKVMLMDLPIGLIDMQL